MSDEGKKNIIEDENPEEDKKLFWNKMFSKLPENGPSPRGFMAILIIIVLIGYVIYQRQASGKPEEDVVEETVVVRKVAVCEQPNGELEVKLETMKTDNEEMDSQFFEFEKKLTQESEAIDVERKQYNIGDLPPELMQRINKHNENIKIFNEVMVTAKEKRATELKDLTQIYNGQVSRYNACIDSNK